jgi:2-aminoadipate transaminase
MDKPMTQPVIKFTRGVPPLKVSPPRKYPIVQFRCWQMTPDVVLQYGTSGGYPPLRHYLADQAGVSDNRIAIGEGSLQLCDIAARILLKPGSIWYTSNLPSYDRSINLFRRTGATLVGIPT